MFNFHIGIPGIVPDLLHSVVQAGLLDKDGAPAVLSRALWQEQFRSLVNSKWTKDAIDVEALSAVGVTIADLASNGTVAVSQHAMLGAPEDCFFKHKALPYADARIERTSEIFATVPLTFHLTIFSQYDYFHAMVNRLPTESSLPHLGMVPSWSALVERIRAAAPGRQLVVWDFERPDRVALAFIIRLLNINDASLIDEMDALLSKTIQRPVYQNSYEDLNIPDDLIEKMDMQYDLDLEGIRKIDGVSLIHSENIPEEFYL